MVTNDLGISERMSGTMSAYVLHHYNWSESSLVLELLTLEHGRMTVLAKGAKRPYSQLRSVLLPFQRILIGLTKGGVGAITGGSDIRTLRSAQWAGGPAMLHGDALFKGFYLNELLLKLVPRHEPIRVLFDSYAQTIKALHTADDSGAQAALRAFELRLLTELGVMPELTVCTFTQQHVLPESRYYLAPESGVVEAGPACNAETLSGALLVTLQAALLHGGFDALQNACRAPVKFLKSTLRALLEWQLGSSSLSTRQVLLQLHALEK